MIEILIILGAVLSFLGAAKKGRRRRYLFVPRIKESAAAGALVTNDLTATIFTGVLDRQGWVTSIDVLVTRHGFTAGEGPIIVGIAHGDYTPPEIEEWLEATTSWTSSDKIEQEQARRKCRQIGIINDPGSSEPYNQGRVQRVKCGWFLAVGETLQTWIYNDSAANLTTGGVVELTGKAYIVPK